MISSEHEGLKNAVPLQKIKVEVTENDNTSNPKMCDKTFLSSEASGHHVKMESYNASPSLNNVMWFGNQTYYYDLTPKIEHNTTENKGNMMSLPSDDINNAIIKTETGPQVKRELIEQVEVKDPAEKIIAKEERDSQVMFYTNTFPLDPWGFKFTPVYSQIDAPTAPKVNREEYCNKEYEENRIINEATDCSLETTRRLSGQTGDFDIRTSSGMEQFVCNLCGYSSCVKEIFIRHTITHSKEKLFTCHICDYKCNDLNGIMIHIRTHPSERPFACNICNYKCKQQAHLNVHITKHTGEKPFACHVCNHKSNNRSSLKRHVRTHTGEKPFACHLCDYKCIEKSRLNLHVRKHTDEKPFACHVCDYKSNDKSSLKRHFIKHTGEKRFACHICDYKCYDKSKLERHIRTHTGEKPFACHLCDYKSIDKSKLNIHARTHNS